MKPKKYKLLKSYPDSPTVGSVLVEQKGFYDGYYENEIGEVVSEGAVEDNPEFYKKLNNYLFITEDGAEMKESDKYYYVVDNEIHPKRYEPLYGVVDWNNSLKVPLGKVQFANIEAAEEWIRRNKPKYSEQQVLECLRDFERDVYGEEDYHLDVYKGHLPRK